jgi:hypothetical protein
LNKEEVIETIKKGFEVGDKDYLDSIGVQFKKLNFNDSIWVRSSRIFKEIPPINYDNQERYLKKSQFFELEDSLGVYLVKIEEVKELNDIAPLSFVVPTIKQVLLNRRRLDYLRKTRKQKSRMKLLGIKNLKFLQMRNNIFFWAFCCLALTAGRSQEKPGKPPKRSWQKL